MLLGGEFVERCHPPSGSLVFGLESDICQYCNSLFSLSLRDFFKESLCYAKVDYCLEPHLDDKEAQIRFPVMSHSVVSSKVKV